MRSILKILCCILPLSLSSCGSFTSNRIAGNIASRISLGYQGPELEEVCDTSNNPTITNGISVFIEAGYEYRPVSIETGSEGLRDIASSTKPIRGAEYIVQNSSKNIVYCGFTGEFGTSTFNLPDDGQFYEVTIKSRDNFYANVLKSPESNQLYEISRSFIANSNKNLTLTAQADNNEITGGAFNILDQVYESMAKVEELLSGINCNGVNCADINAFPKADIFWEAGFNPGSYIQGEPTLSFYNRRYNRVFILGGSNGDVAFTDTDHFDNSIIIHEFFHYIESNLSRTNSPGGSHNGNQLLNPMLAWSEGVAQFFQALVTDIPAVLDTRGNTDGDTGFLLKLSVEHRTNDIPLHPGEGEFREFSVARTLWDLYDTNTDLPFDSVNANNNNLDFFEKFWVTLTSTVNGFASDTVNFRSSGLLHNISESNNGTALPQEWKNILETELHYNGEDAISIRGEEDATQTTPPLAGAIDEDITYTKRYRGQYAQKLVTCGAETPFRMFSPFFCNEDYDGTGECVDNSNVAGHHLVQNSDYYHVTLNGTSDISIVFADTSFAPSGVKADLDLYLFTIEPEDDTDPDSLDVFKFITSSTNDNSLPNDYDLNEVEGFSNLQAGEYLIQVFTRNFSSTTSEITYTFNNLCAEGS